MADARASSLLRYMGLSGSSGARTGSLVPRAQTPDADQRLWQEFQDSGRIADPEVWNKFQQNFRRPQTLDAMLQLWEDMSQWDLIAAALVEIVDEATQTDSNSPGVLWYQCNDAGFEEELNNMLVNLDVETNIQSQVWYVAGLGNSFEKLEYAPHEGILGMTFVHPMEMRRYWLERNRKCVGFRWQGHKPNKEDVFVQPDNKTPVERVSMANGQNIEDLWYPWDFCAVGDTKISLLDGREISLENLQKEVGEGEFWVYSSTPNGRIVPGRAHSLRLTRKAARVVEVELNNGEKVRFTPDHKFMLRDGTYREAGKLHPGDSLMPLYRKLSTIEEHERKDYEMFFDNDANRWRFTHWRTAEVVHGTPRGKDGRFCSDICHVHHVDFNKRNNAPKNLKWLTVAEHNKVHSDINRDPAHKDKQRQAASEAMKRTWRIKRDLMLAAAAKSNQRPERRAANRSQMTAMQARRKTDPEFAAKLSKANRRNATASIQAKRILKDPKTGRFYNHKVVAVRDAGVSDVYDFEVDGQHNFALSAGVFVHNCHFRRMFRMRMSEHGEPIFAEADGIYKKLRLAIDQMVVCRAQVQPDRYAISIDVQEQPPVEQMKTVQRWRQALRSKLAFGGGNATNELGAVGDFSSYYNALALDTMIYIAQPKGFNNIITKLPGTADVPDVYDIELLTDLFYSIIGMPKAWFSGGQGSGGGGEMPSGRALLAQDIRFLRKIKAIRKPITTQYQWLGYFHAVLKGKDVEQLDIKAMMPQIGSLEEQLKLEMLGIQADVLQKLGDVMEQYSLPKEAWIDTVFKRYMHLPDEIVSVFMTALPSEIEQQQQDQKGESKKGAPSTLKLINEIHAKISNTPGAANAIRMLKEVVYKEKLTDKPKSKWTRDRVFAKPAMQENDVIISSFGKHPFELRRKGISESKNGKTDMTGVIQRKMDSKTTGWDDDDVTVPINESKVNGEPGPGNIEPYRKWIG